MSFGFFRFQESDDAGVYSEWEIGIPKDSKIWLKINNTKTLQHP